LGKTVLLTGISSQYAVAKALRKRIPDAGSLPLLAFEDVDHALEWCEDYLLLAQNSCPDGETALALQPLCAGFLPEELALLESMLENRRYAKGEFLCREGDPADSLFFVMSGQVSVTVPLTQHRTARISTFSAGSALGEMAMLDQGKRSADIVADSPVNCMVLHYGLFESHTSPMVAPVRLKLVTNIARVLTRKLRQATLEIKLLRS
jgi:glutaminase